MWSTFSKQQTSSVLVPTPYDPVTIYEIPIIQSNNFELVYGVEDNLIEIISSPPPQQNITNIRYANFSIAPDTDLDGNPIQIYINIGWTSSAPPSPFIPSFILLSGHQEVNMQLSNYKVIAVAKVPIGKLNNPNIRMAVQVAESQVLNF